MQGIYYLLSIVASFVVFIWYIRNDGLAEGEPTHGLLAMKEPTPPGWPHQSADGPKKALASSASSGSAGAGTGNPTRSHLHPRAH